MTQNPNTGLNKVKYKLKGGTHFCLVKTKLVVFQGSIFVFFLFLFSSFIVSAVSSIWKSSELDLWF